MSRKVLIAGNWKMNGLTASGVALAKEIATSAKTMKPKCEVLVCPPFTLLSNVKKALRGSKVMLGAQNCHTEEKGAHTGDVSPYMLKDAGCDYVILGHSERRTDHKESSALVKAKAESALKAGLKVIICVGETLDERNKGKALSVTEKQVKDSLPDGATASNTVIAYEPVWAIGTGKTATPDDAEEVHAHIRKVLAQKLSKSVASRMRILYGGSMKPQNASELLSKEDIDGGLIGGASLKAEDFMTIVSKAK
ncbi:MAG: triose-phosphate isomerase [Alphaproteobacteria bacterium]|nr:triose-phosphate isomerase [Alphaproteobacteria bacterium]